MLHILTHNILPVFAMLALGFAMGRTGKADASEAKAANRIAFIVMQPLLLFLLMIGLDVQTFDPVALGLYALCEIIAFTIAYLTARRIFKREPLESWLLAMAVIFVNTVLYIWPISVPIYGEAGALPIKAIVAWDAAVAFSFFIISMEVMTGRAAPAQTARRLAMNPVLLAQVLGLFVNLANIPVPEPVITAARFASVAAAALTLFALGVILSGHSLIPGPTVIAMSALKLLLFPALVLGSMATITPANPWQGQFVLTAAGPSGAMAFSLAMLYGVYTDAIAPVIIWTSTLSLISLAYLA